MDEVVRDRSTMGLRPFCHFLHHQASVRQCTPRVRPALLKTQSRSLIDEGSHVPFPTYILTLLAALPWSLVFGYHGESASVLLLGLAGGLSVVLAALPLVQSAGFSNTSKVVCLPLADAFTSILLRRAVHSSRLQLNIRLRLAQATKQEETITGKLRLICGILLQLFPLITRGTSILVMMMLPIVILSGELQDMHSNCYLLDSPFLWLCIAAGSALHGASLIFLILSATITTPFTLTFLQAPVCGVALIVFCYSKLTLQVWMNVCLCMIFGLILACQKSDESFVPHANGSRNFCDWARKAFLAIVLYGALWQGSRTLEEYLTAGALSLPLFVDKGHDSAAHNNGSFIKLLEATHGGHDDDYLGSRPTTDTFADFNDIIANCADVADGNGVDDVVNCLSYLAASEEDYLVSPENDSERSFGALKWRSHPIHRERKNDQTTHQGAEVKPQSSDGLCSGPVIPFHTYWTGPATWRFELFIKAYLYTQNLPCSRLWVWLDADVDPSAIEKMLYHDSLFQRFGNLVDDNYIFLRKWTFPERIPLPRTSNGTETFSLYKNSYTDENNDMAVADGVIQDASGQLWLIPDAIYRTVSTPTQVSDFVRFYVLHLHGGVYLDLDVLLLRDLRPLLLPNPASGSILQPAWAEQWVERCSPGDYNTAVLSLPANSSLTSYLLHGGLRMSMNFHPKIIGQMLWKDGRNSEVAMLQNAFFDPLVTNLRRKGTGMCTVPCHKNFKSSFMEVVDEPQDEWSNYHGNDVVDSVILNTGDDTTLGTNRSMEHFFRGAFAYHIHNQVSRIPSTVSPIVSMLMEPHPVVEIPRT